MDCVEQLVSGYFPSEFPFAYNSEFDAGSPWSLCLALYPETCKIPHTNLKSLCSGTGVELDPSVGEFVQSECLRLGWSGTLPPQETITSFFLKIRLRLTDSVCRQLDIPSNVTQKEFPYGDGLVRVLQLWRKFAGLAATPELSTFESMAPESVFKELIAVMPPGWDLRQRLEFLVMPYLRFKGRVDIVQKFISDTENIENISGSVFIPELATPILEACLKCSPVHWHLVRQVVDNITSSSENTGTEITLKSLIIPQPRSLAFWDHLVDAARLNKLPAQSFEQLAEWALGNSSTQEALLIRFLSSEAHFTLQEINTLKNSVFQKVNAQFVNEEIVKASFHKSRFMFLKSNLLHDETELVIKESLKLVAVFNEDPSNANLQKLLMALELISAVPAADDLPELKGLKTKYEKLNKMHKSFGVEPQFAVVHTPLENVARALELDTQAYLRFTDLVNFVGGPENSEKVAEQCVETALADHNFDIALEFFERQFVKPDSSSTAWLAYYQAGKYISPDWDLPRPRHILKKQIELLSKALLTCGESDLFTVLRAWSAADAELTSTDDISKEEQILPAVSQESSHTKAEAFIENPREGHSATNQISNLLVSGIGWAIGANQ